MTAEKGESEAKRVQLFEERGDTSRFVDAEIKENGDLVVSGQDIGRAPLEWWGDSDYEFWATVASKDKHRILEVLSKASREAGTSFPTLPQDEDTALLALLKHFYCGHFHAVDEFEDFLQFQGIPFEGMTWA